MANYKINSIDAKKGIINVSFSDGIPQDISSVSIPSLNEKGETSYVTVRPPLNDATTLDEALSRMAQAYESGKVLEEEQATVSPAVEAMKGVTIEATPEMDISEKVPAVKAVLEATE